MMPVKSRGLRATALLAACMGGFMSAQAEVEDDPQRSGITPQRLARTVEPIGDFFKRRLAAETATMAAAQAKRERKNTKRARHGL